MQGPDLKKWGLADPWADPKRASAADAAQVLAVQQALVAYMLYAQTERMLRQDAGDRTGVREAEKNHDMAYRTGIILASILKAPSV